MIRDQIKIQRHSSIFMLESRLLIVYKQSIDTNGKNSSSLQPFFIKYFLIMAPISFLCQPNSPFSPPNCPLHLNFFILFHFATQTAPASRTHTQKYQNTQLHKCHSTKIIMIMQGLRDDIKWTVGITIISFLF